MKTPRVPEKAVQQQIVKLLGSVGCRVHVLGTRRGRGERDHGTHQTPGIPDLHAFVPVRATSDGGATYVPLWVEVKAEGGRLRPEQRDFQACCQAAGVAHVVGGYDEVIAWLAARGLVRPQYVPHYRQPAGAQS